ncbi:MAG: SGNH/GDSL hydrolase family protein [Tannerella sp.]|nr:SGNH/GDSL hydrolase family protein [Tannerella sp.]
MGNKNCMSRRGFLTAAGLAGLAPVAAWASKRLPTEKKYKLHKVPAEAQGLRFLFQGDSITDGNWGQNGSKVRRADGNNILGHGYVFAIAARIGADFPQADFTFMNRGVWGNTLLNLEARWQADALDLKPDVLSVLVGVNDVMDVVRHQGHPYGGPEVFEAKYRGLLQKSREQNPNLLIVLGLPFIYPVGRYAHDIESSRKEMAPRVAAVRRLAQEFNAVLVDYPAMFERATTLAPIDYWIWDGCHPSVFGHELMAREWLHQTASRLSFLKLYDSGY